MNPEIRRYIRHYAYGLFAKSWNGAWSAVECAFGLAAGAMVTATIDFPTWQGVLAVFITTFLRNAITYFAKNPIPRNSPPTPPRPFPPMKTKLHPLVSLLALCSLLLAPCFLTGCATGKVDDSGLIQTVLDVMVPADFHGDLQANNPLP